MAINKIPKNYYSDTNIRRDKINEIIDEVNDIASIPSPSEADAGKVVKVSAEGSYELAQDAGAKELIITLANNFTADKTYTEILAALNSGDIVKLVDWTGRNYIYSGMTSGRICFAYLNGYSNTNESDVFTVAVDDTNSWEMFLDTIDHLPDVTSADAGKVLTVDSSGKWGADNVPSGDVIIFHATISSLSGGSLELDNGLTFQTVKDAIDNNKIVIIQAWNSKRPINYYATFNYGFFGFGLASANDVNFYSFNISSRLSESSVTVTGKTIALS